MITQEDKKYELNENYKNLIAAVIYKACEDYSNVLVYAKKHKDCDPHKKPVYKFLMDSDNPYAEILDISLPAMVHRMEKNVKKYGKGLLKPDDWSKIKKGKELTDKYGKEQIYV